MTELFVEDFKFGLDLRRSALTSHAGSLRILDNCVVTQGGEIEKRKAFVPFCNLPPATAGLYGTTSPGEGALGDTMRLSVFQMAGFGFPPVVAAVGSGFLPNDGGEWVVDYHVLQNVDVSWIGYQINGVEAYGPGHFFVTGYVVQDPTHTGAYEFAPTNWWDRIVVPGYIGFSPLSYGQKMYRAQGKTLYFSGIGDPSDTNPLNPGGTGPNTVHPGAGFIDTSLLSSDASEIVGLAAYYKQVAVFTRQACLLFALDPDPSQNTLQQVLANTGTVSANATRQFGTGDVLFLAPSGVRSLRALNASLAASVTDVGSPIDALLQPVLASYATWGITGRASCPSVIEPNTGRYWVAIGGTIYVLSNWPSAKISAWSTFTLPFNVDAMTTAGGRVFVRGNLGGTDQVFVYGGFNGTTYDACTANVLTPHMAAETPTTEKTAETFSAALTGTWTASVGYSPENLAAMEPFATLTGNTYGQQSIPLAAKGTHFAFGLTCSDASPATLGGLSVRFAKGREK